MSYSIPYDPSYPDGDVVDADDIDLVDRNIKQMFIERTNDLLGTDFTQDPMHMTKLDNGATKAAGSKTWVVPHYYQGPVGSTYAIDLSQTPKPYFTLTTNCTVTFPSPTEDASGYIYVLQGGAGGFNISWGPNVSFSYNSAPAVSTSAGYFTVYAYTVFAGKVFIALFGSQFNV